jgi:hypothetical protein
MNRADWIAKLNGATDTPSPASSPDPLAKQRATLTAELAMLGINLPMLGKAMSTLTGSSSRQELSDNAAAAGRAIKTLRDTLEAVSDAGADFCEAFTAADDAKAAKAQS